MRREYQSNTSAEALKDCAGHSPGTDEKTCHVMQRLAANHVDTMPTVMSL